MGWEEWDDDPDFMLAQLFGRDSGEFDEDDDHPANIEEHYEAIVHLYWNYQWLDGDANTSDIRKMHLQRLLNMRSWMDRKHSSNTPYRETKQYQLVRSLIAKDQKWLDLAKKALAAKPRHNYQRKLSWHQQETLRSIQDSSPSSKETPAPASQSRRAPIQGTRQSRKSAPTSSTTTGE